MKNALVDSFDSLNEQKIRWLLKGEQLFPHMSPHWTDAGPRVVKAQVV